MPAPYPSAQIGTLYRRDDRSLNEKYGELLAPYFRIEISDQDDRVLFYAESNANEGNYDLNGLLISDVEWAEDDCQASMMTLTIQNADMKMHNTRLFIEGNILDLWIGYDGFVPDYMGRAIIVEVAPEFPVAAMPTIRVTAYDISHFMMEEGRAEIQTEGTKWWERNKLPTNANPQPNNAIVTNQVQNTAGDRERQRSRAGPSLASFIPEETVDNFPQSLHVLEDREIRTRESTTQSNTTQPRGRTPLKPAKIKRRRNKRGKVWRQLRDDEIVSKIFESYGIVPYVEALRQKSRAKTEEREIAHTGPVTLDRVEDTVKKKEERQEQLRREARAQTPNSQLSIEEDLARAKPAEKVIRADRVNDTTVKITVEIGGRTVVQKAGTTDWQFIKKLAKNHGYVVFVFFHYESKKWIGYWGSPHYVPQYVIYDFHYNDGDSTTIQTFRPKLSTIGQKTEIDLLYVDPITRKQQKLRVSMENLSIYSPEFRGPDSSAVIRKPLGTGPEVVLNVNGQRTSVQADRRFRSMEEAKQWLMAFWYQHASEFCEAEGDFIVGLPEIHCRHKHSMNGFDRYDGEYFLTQVTHKISPKQMYKTTFSGYRVVDMLWSPPDQENESMTLESNNLGEWAPPALTPEIRWEIAKES